MRNQVLAVPISNHLNSYNTRRVVQSDNLKLEGLLIRAVLVPSQTTFDDSVSDGFSCKVTTSGVTGDCGFDTVLEVPSLRALSSRKI